MEKIQNREDNQSSLAEPLPTFDRRTSALQSILGQCKDTTNANRGTIKFDFSTIKNASRRITAA